MVFAIDGIQKQSPGDVSGIARVRDGLYQCSERSGQAILVALWLALRSSPNNEHSTELCPWVLTISNHIPGHSKGRRDWLNNVITALVERLLKQSRPFHAGRHRGGPYVKGLSSFHCNCPGSCIHSTQRLLNPLFDANLELSQSFTSVLHT